MFQHAPYYRRKFKWWVDRYGENILLIHRTEEMRCPGAFNPYTDEYDPARDRQYHEEHPEEPWCEYGYLGTKRIEEPVKVFISFKLTEALARLIPPDEFQQGDLIAYYPWDVTLEDIEMIEYPVDSGEYYGIYRRDTWNWDNEPIYHYAFCRLLTTSSLDEP